MRCVLQLKFNRSPTAWPQPSDGRANCRVYRSLNGIVEGLATGRALSLWASERCGTGVRKENASSQPAKARF